MLSKQKRLNLKKTFSWVATGQRIETSLFKLFFRFDETIDPKVGIAVSSTVFKKAVQRNRARRVVSKAFENLYPRLRKGLNIIALPKSSVLEFNAEEITRQLEKTLLQKGLLR